jgi:hypothetical protein
MGTQRGPGLRALQEKDYAYAVLCFEKDLADGAGQSHRSATSTYLALSRMALVPPAQRTSAQLDRILTDLRQAGSTPLVAALASVLTQDWYQRHPHTTGPAPLELPVGVELLDASDVRLLAEHLHAHLGETWCRLDRHARRYQSRLRHEGARDADPDRRAKVERYCAPDPMPPDPLPARRTRAATPWPVTAAGAAALAATVLLGAWLGGVLAEPWALGFALLLVVVAAGAPVLAVALVRWGRRAVDGPHDGRYGPDARAAAPRATTPRATDAEMDRWLAEEVDRIVTYGASRQRISRAGGPDHRPGPTAAPLVLVGLSGIRRDHRYYRDAPEIEPRSWLDHGYAEMERSLVITAARRGAPGNLLRANRYDVLVLYPEPDSFFVFRADLDLASGTLLSTSTQTVRYASVITTYNRELPSQDIAENPITIRYADGLREQRPVFADRCFALTMPGQRVEITTGVSRHRAGPGGAVRVAWPNAAAQRMIEQLVWPPREERAPTTEDERPTG